MSDLTHYEEPRPEQTSELVEWARDATAAHRIAQSLAGTAFVSGTMRGKPHEITAAILTGQEIGLRPMSALRSIDVIQGTPAMRAVAMRGLVQAHGHELWVETQTDTRAVVKGRRRGSDVEQQSVWTIERAGKLGLTNKDNWKKQPGAMLVARATAELCRLIASDVLLGVPYAVEELDEGDAPAPTARKIKRRRVPAESFSRPPTPDEAPEPETDVAVEEEMTDELPLPDEGDE